MKHILSTQDFSRENIEYLIAQADVMLGYYETQRRPPETVLSFNRQLAKTTLLFLEPSTRTCYSYQEAARLCGFDTIVLADKEMTSWKKGETLADTVRMLAGQGANILVIRSPHEGAARFAAEIVDKSDYGISVQNGGDGANQHPTQALLDLFTIYKTLGRLDNFTFGAVGDLRFSRVLHSDLQALKKFSGIKIRLVSAPETKLPDSYKKGFNEVIEEDNLSLLADCDIVVALRIQEERFTDPNELSRVRGRYVINQDVLDKILRSDIRIMHPLPRKEEIAPEISCDPRIIIFRQAELGIPMRMALLKMGYEARRETNESQTIAPPDWDIIVQEPVHDHLQKRQKEGKYFRPIENGVVIDHLPFHFADILRRALGKILKAGDGRVIHSIEGVPSVSQDYKDVLVLENIFPDGNALSVIAFLAPSATFNHIKEGKFTKQGITELPGMIFDFLKCPNPVCITNIEPEARTKFIPSNSGEVECYYCNRYFSREEILRTLKK